MRSLTFMALLALTALGGCSAESPAAPEAAAPSGSGNPTSTNSASARWTRVRYSATGGVTLAVANNVATLTFTSDFTVDQTPGPYLYLNTTNNPNSGTPLRVGALRSRSGAQSYSFPVPPGVKYTYVLIWCEPFNVPMVEAAIPPTGG